MRNFLALAVILMISLQLPGQGIDQILLDAGWKFREGDNPEWKEKNYNDNDWKDILPSAYWDYLHDYDYDGYGWYRISFFLPSSLREGLMESDSIYLFLGIIDDNDETFLNGTLVGRNAENVTPGDTGEFANVQFKYNLERNYSLPLDSDILEWDKVNTLAVRVYDIWLTAGLKTPRPRIYTGKSWENHIWVRRESLHPSIFRLGKSSELSFLIGNDKPEVLNVMFIADMYEGDSDYPAFTRTRHVSVPARSEQRIIVSFPHLVEDFCHVSYRIIEDFTKYSTGNKELFGIPGREIRLLDYILPPVVKDKVPLQYRPVPLHDIRIKGYLGYRLDLDIEKGLSLFPEHFLVHYFNGEEPMWPIGELAKALHGGTKILRYEDNRKLFEVIQAINTIWIEKQAKDGYLGTYLPENRWNTWDVWDHKYVMIGLLHFYSITGYEPALDAARKIADLVIDTFGNEPGKKDLMINGPHMGMASGSILEPMVYLYKYTGEKKYFEFCKYIVEAFEHENGPKIVTELTEGFGTVFKVGNGKGYEMMSCLIGLVNMYRLTGNENLKKAVIQAWDDIAENRLYITGTATEFEHFTEKGQLGAGKENSMGEGCVTAHWMYFSKELFWLTGEQKYMDEIDKSLYNHLLAAQHPISGNVVYYTALQDRKEYIPFDLNLGPPPCCHLSVKRAISEIPELSFYIHDKELGINLYNPADLHTQIPGSAEGELSLSIVSIMPHNGNIEIRVDPEREAEFTISLRVPSWTHEFKASLENLEYRVNSGEFLRISRRWIPGDKINIKMDYPIVMLEGGQSYPDHFAIKYGPRVLAVDSDVNNIKDLESVYFDTRKKLKVKPYQGELPEKWVGDQAYTTSSVRGPDGKEIILVPFAEASQTGGDIRVWIKSK